jgi:hypothetical protein
VCDKQKATQEKKMSVIGNYQAGFVPSRARSDAAAAPAKLWAADKASEKQILRTLSRNYGVMSGRRRHSAGSRGDFGQHFRNPLKIVPYDPGPDGLFGAPAGSSAHDPTTSQELCMNVPTSDVDYVNIPESQYFHSGQ